jgi:predicted TIM-barrel fold metal-dependent hydrolase
VRASRRDAIGIRLRDVIGVDNMMWGSDYPHSESTFPQSRKILAEILKGVPDDEQARIAGDNTARVYNFDVARLTVPIKLASGSAAEQVLLINLDDVEDGIKELERAARLGLAGAMITEYPLEHRRYDQPEYEPFWAAPPVSTTFEPGFLRQRG